MRSLVVFFGLVLAFTPISQAQSCTGSGSGTGGAVLKDITVDGDPTDWSDVLASPQQVTVDDDGSSMSSADCGTLSSDRDCPVGNTGRDLNTFTWTYNDTRLFIYQTRYGSTSNTQDFWFYMDVDQNEAMEDTDYMLHVAYQGSNDSTDVELWQFDPPGGMPSVEMICPATGLDGNGDPCAIGYADGYTMPGDFTGTGPGGGTPLVDYGDQAGGFNSGSSLDGAGFEIFVDWADLGLSGPAAIYFHIAGSNGTNLPNSVQDNAGGPDGRNGIFGFFQIEITPDGSATLAAPASDSVQSFLHTVTNQGTIEDEVEISVSSTNGWEIELYDSGTLIARDSNGDGIWETIRPAYQSVDTSNPVIGSLAPNATFSLEVRVTVPGGTVQAVETSAVFASFVGESATDCVTETIIVGSVLVEPDLSLTGIQGDSIDFDHTVVHYLGSDIVNLSAVSAMGWQIEYFDGATSMALDLNGDGDFLDAGDVLNLAYDTDLDGLPDTGTLSASSVFNLRLTLTIPNPTAVDTIDTVVITGAAVSAGLSDIATDTLTVKNQLTIEADTSKFGAQGYSIYFPHTVTNSLSNSDTANYTWTLSEGGLPVSWTVKIWDDPDCDGSTIGSTEVTASGTLINNGGTECIIAEVQVAASATEGATATLVITATSALNGASDDVTDSIAVAQLIPCIDSACTGTEVFWTYCETIYLRGVNFTPGEVYGIDYYDENPGVAPTVRNATQIANGVGEFTDSYTIGALTNAGLWEIQALLFSDSSLQESINITIEPAAGANTIDPLLTDSALYPSTGATVNVDGTLNNTNAGADHNATTYRYVIRSTDLGWYYDNVTSAFVAYTGIEWTRTFTSTVLAGDSLLQSGGHVGLSFPQDGAWEVYAEWTSCSGSYSIDTALTSFLVGADLESYSDSGRTTQSDAFLLDDTIYLQGSNYSASTGYTVAYFDSSGALISSSTVTSNGSGLLQPTADTGTWAVIATVTAAVYTPGTTAPASYDAAATALIVTDTFALSILAPSIDSPILENETSISGTSTYPTGTTITVYVDGASVGTTTVSGGGTWTLSGLSALVVGESVTATATINTVEGAVSAAVLVEPASVNEVSGNGVGNYAILSRDDASSTGWFLYFEQLSGVDGYNVYEGTYATYYDHTCLATDVTAALMGGGGFSGWMRAEITPSMSGNTYYLITAFRSTVEGSYGVDSAATDRPSGASICPF